MSLTFKKSARLLKRYEFKRVSKNGKRLVGSLLRIDFTLHLSSNTPPKLGITASTHYGNSPERNRFKRLVRESFRLFQHELPLGLSINVLPRKLAKTARLVDIQKEILKLCATIIPAYAQR